MPRRIGLILLVAAIDATVVRADPPVASYIFPAGGQRGRTVDVRVGGLFLYRRCAFEMVGPGVKADPELRQIPTRWLEGPLLPLPESQQAEDYPKDMAGRIRLDADATPGVRYARLATSQGVTSSLKFMVGELPEVLEEETEGDPVPVAVTLPLTINGRIFPREDVDIWSFTARAGQSVTCEAHAARLGSPLEARLEIRDAEGRRLAENDRASDPILRFQAPRDGTYQVRIHDSSFRGGQAYVYRLTFTSDPYVERIYPLGGRRGSEVALQLAGQGVPATTVPLSIPADAAPAHLARLTIDGRPANLFALEVDDLPEYLEKQQNEQPGQAQLLTLPAVANGRIEQPGDSDVWSFSAKKGEEWELDLRAARLGSPLFGVLTVTDATGKELARADGAMSNGDPTLRFAAPAEATYFVRIEERFRTRGGPEYAYRLRIAPASAPSFTLYLAADAISVPRGGQAKLKVELVRRGSGADQITLQVEGLPPGVTANATPIRPTKAKGTVTGEGGEITFKAAADAPIRTAKLTVRGVMKNGANTISHTATLPAPRGQLELDSVLLAVALPTPFKIIGEYDMRWASRGTTHRRHYKVERNGFEGPIEVSLADRQARHLQGVTGPTIVVPAGVSEFDYAVSLPPWMETGRTSRTCVMGVGVIKDAEGKEHVVSFSSTGQNEQVIAVVEPGRLDVEATPSSLLPTANETAILSVQVGRGKGLEGPVRLEVIVPAHLHGIQAESITVPAGESRTRLPIRFNGAAGASLNAPLTLRATLMDRGNPVVAETKLGLRSSHEHHESTKVQK